MIKFDTLQEIFISIQNNFYDRELMWRIGSAYAFEENPDMGFGEKTEGYGFLFQFFINEQLELPDPEIKMIIDQLAGLGDAVENKREVKRILYHKELDELREKYAKKLISELVYNEQMERYLL